MAYVTGPLQSLNASKQFGKSMIFQTYKNRSYCKRYAVPRNDRTPEQIGIRSMVFYLTKLWKNLPAEDQATWIAPAINQNVSPFNAYFIENMHRWRNTLGPMTALQTPPSEAYAPTITLDAIGGDGKVDLAIAPTVIPQHVNVTAGSPPSNPDASGFYQYFEEHESEHAYRRTGDTPFRLFWYPTPSHWILRKADTYANSFLGWYRSTPINGTYAPDTDVTGNPVASADIPEAPDTPAEAVVIFRDLSTPATPDRRICRAVLDLDENGEVSWTDTGQIGGKAGPPGGLPAGVYHYMALPLSLDGRVGTPTADTPATVT